MTERHLSQLREKAPGLFARLPNSDYLMAGAHEVADQVKIVQRQVADMQRQVVDQVRTVASPLAHQAAPRSRRPLRAMQNGRALPV